MTQEQLTFFLHKFRNIDITNHEQRQRLIDIFVNAIYLYDDKIIFTFNYKDSSKTVSLKEIEGSDLARSGAVMQVMNMWNDLLKYKEVKLHMNCRSCAAHVTGRQPACVVCHVTQRIASNF